MCSSFEFDKIVGELGRELTRSPEILRAVKLALACLTPEEQELIVNKIKLGVPTTALMKRYNIGSSSGLESIYQRTLAILRIYVGFFVGTPDPRLRHQLPGLFRPYGHLLTQIFDGQDRNCLIADTGYTGEQLDGMMDCARAASVSIKDEQTKSLVEATIALWPHKRLGATPQKRDARQARKQYHRSVNNGK